MKITAQEEYGLRCLLQLARVPEGTLVSVKDVAAKEGISAAYVEKLLRLLAKGGLVHSVRGMKGGYGLNRPAAQITLLEVMRELGTVETTSHICKTYTGNVEQCVHFEGCGIRSVWAYLTAHIGEMLQRTTLDMLLKDEYAVSNALAQQNRIQGVL